jgi:predicted MFS family arabinose efflux permease
MLAMIVFGVGEVVGCFFIGYFIDHFGCKFSTIVICII